MNGPWEGRVIPLVGAGPWSIGRGNGNTARSGESPMKTAVKPEETAKDSPLADQAKAVGQEMGESLKDSAAAS